jgi:hypothetical protein
VAAGGTDAGGTDGPGAGQATATTTEDTPGSAEPTVAVPVVSTPSAPPHHGAPHSEDSINLVRLVGPAILKRVVPVAAALAALTLLGRRFRHLFRRDKKA